MVNEIEIGYASLRAFASKSRFQLRDGFLGRFFLKEKIRQCPYRLKIRLFTL